MLNWDIKPQIQNFLQLEVGCAPGEVPVAELLIIERFVRGVAQPTVTVLSVLQFPSRQPGSVG
jgi:hypothetical protein